MVAQEQVEAAQKTATANLKANKNTEQGQRQERLKNAIEHLGHTSDSVRLGGAYELFHLAEDEDTAEGKKDLRQTVLDILCAHIRWTTGKSEYRNNHQSEPSEEIQSLLALLFVQEHEVFTKCDINLRGSWLNGSKLSQARLEKANLRGAQLHRAILGEARLHRANLWEAQLHRANLRGARLHGAILVRAQLHGADLTEAQLHEAALMDAQLHGAYSNPRYLAGPFEAAINEGIGKQSDLTGAISAGGLAPEDVASIGKGLPDEQAKELRKRLEADIGPPEIRDLPESRGAIKGTYTKEAAAQWIAEYKTALSAVSERG